MNNIEKDIDNLIKKNIDKFKYENLFDFEFSFNYHGQELNYFSEIEVDIIFADNIKDVISVIIYSEGKLVKAVEDVEIWFERELKLSIGKIKNVQ